MELLILYTILGTVAVAAIAKFVFDYRVVITNGLGQRCTFNRQELVGYVLLVSLITTFFVGIWGPRAAKADIIGGYNQFLNGSIKKAEELPIPCRKTRHDEHNPCRHTYDCDTYPIQVTKTRTVPDGVDSKGNPKTRTETYQDTEFRNHQCPEATFEYSYYLHDSLGNRYVIDEHVLAANPVDWDGNGMEIGGIPRGRPKRWQQSKDRLDSGNAESVTVRDKYANYVLASESTNHKRHSDSLERYREAGLIPDHTQGLTDGNILSGVPPSARKTQFVGVNADDEDTWNDQLMHFNAALGMEFQGDLHIVVVRSSDVSENDSDDYMNALMVDWQGDRLGKWAFPKNGIALVIAVDKKGKKIEWTRALTGMPRGNERMLDELSIGSKLAGERFDPDVVLGNVEAYVTKGDELKFRYGDGILAQVMFEDYPFQRLCMSKCDDKGDTGTGYLTLEDLVRVRPGELIWPWMFISIFFSIAMALVFIWTNPIHTAWELIQSRRTTASQY